MTEPTWDVVVVGSGAGGSAATYGLCQRGLSVLLLEAGPRFDPATDYAQTEVDWELRDFPDKPGSKREVIIAPGQPLPEQEPLLVSSSVGEGRQADPGERLMGEYEHVCGVGGSTLHFTGEAHRLHPEAMKMRSRFAAAADWPIDYGELEPFYSSAEELVGVAGPITQGARWRSKSFPLPAHPLSYAARTLGTGAAALGLNWQANSRAALSRPYQGRADCNYCGACNMGCMRGDKGSVDLTFIAAALATSRCTLCPDRPVVRIETSPGDRVAAVLVGNADGSLERIPTPHLVLAGGAVQTPRLLLASDNLANESDQVGRNFMETMAVAVVAMHPQPQHGRRGLPNDAICWDFNAPDAIPGVIGGCRFYNASAEAGMMGLATFARNAIAGWGRDHARQVRRMWGHALSVGAIGESLPNDTARVDLDPHGRCDDLGMPLPRITSWLSESDISRLRFMSVKSREILVASGATEIVASASTWDVFASTHIFGTCRMGSDPNTSVVDPTLRSHRWRNLWITDASVFPSSGGGEGPALTIEALALRTAQLIGT